jgi:hypothetical protein
VVIVKDCCSLIFKKNINFNPGKQGSVSMKIDKERSKDSHARKIFAKKKKIFLLKIYYN